MKKYPPTTTDMTSKTVISTDMREAMRSQLIPDTSAQR
jgi:hypothetical protein